MIYFVFHIYTLQNVKTILENYFGKLFHGKYFSFGSETDTEKELK